jgi:hypothetical protein
VIHPTDADIGRLVAYVARQFPEKEDSAVFCRLHSTRKPQDPPSWVYLDFGPKRDECIWSGVLSADVKKCVWAD